MPHAGDCTLLSLTSSLAWRQVASRPRQHSHLPRHRVYPRHVLAELNSSSLRRRLSRLASKPLARTKVNVSRDKPYCQPDCAPVRCAFHGPSYVSPRVQLRTHVLWDIPDAFPLRSIGSAMLIMSCFWSAGLGDEVVVRVTTSLIFQAQGVTTTSEPLSSPLVDPNSVSTHVW